MKNQEMIQHYNDLATMQEKEKEYYERKGTQLLGGRIRVTYAIKKNMEELLGKLKPYQDTLRELYEEYHDQEKETAVYREAMKQWQESTERETKKKPQMSEIYKKEKNKEEYERKLKELMDIDVQDVNICKIDVPLLDGLELSSSDLNTFMFMLIEE